MKQSSRFTILWMWLVTLLCCLSAAADDIKSVPPSTTDAPLRALQLVDVSGRKHLPFADTSVDAVVLVFVSVDCPVANAFQPALDEIHSAYAKRGVSFFQVHSSVREERDRVKQHMTDYRINMPVVMDTSQLVARSAKARVTPEAIVIDRTGVVRYRGLINNLYVGFGKKRRQATVHYLTDALDSLLAGDPVKTPTTKPVGCFIHYEESE